mgnify:CR=1 FL=1
MEKKLILGTTQFGLSYGINNKVGQISNNEAAKILDYAYEKDLVILDTAPVYGNSEKLIGDYLKKNKHKEFRIITKISSNKESLSQQFLKSLQNMRVEKVNTILFHSIELYKHFKSEINSFLEKFKGSRFNELGVSLYTNDDIISVIGDKRIDRVQVPFNLLDNASKRESVFLELKADSKKVDTRSIFLQGLFFKPPPEIPFFFNPIREELFSLHKLSKDFRISINCIALTYAIQKNYIDSVLIGVDSFNHLKKNLSSINNEIPKELSNIIDSINIKDEHILNPSLWPKF